MPLFIYTAYSLQIVWFSVWFSLIYFASPCSLRSCPLPIIPLCLSWKKKQKKKRLIAGYSPCRQGYYNSYCQLLRPTDQATTEGTLCPTFCKQCVGSLVSSLPRSGQCLWLVVPEHPAAREKFFWYPGYGSIKLWFSVLAHKYVKSKRG